MNEWCVVRYQPWRDPDYEGISVTDCLWVQKATVVTFAIVNSNVLTYKLKTHAHTTHFSQKHENSDSDASTSHRNHPTAPHSVAPAPPATDRHGEVRLMYLSISFGHWRSGLRIVGRSLRRSPGGKGRPGWHDQERLFLWRLLIFPSLSLSLSTSL